MTYTAGTSSTPYGFTGETTDANKLIYLRARYYNPAGARFLSRDTWAGDVNNPLSLNRWMYVEGNPINYTDPTGLIKKSESRNAEVILDKLHHWYNISIKKDWGYLNQFINTNNRYINESLIDCNQWVPGNWRSLRELQLTLHAVNKMSNELGGRGAFLSAMRWQPIRIYRIPARTFFGYGGYSINNVILPDNPFDTSDLKGKRLIIHELAHVWDFRSQQQLSRNMMYITNSFRKECGKGVCYDYYDPTNANEKALSVNNNYAENNAREDWAVSFGYYVFPGSDASTVLGPIRKNYIESVINNLSGSQTALWRINVR